MQHNLCCHTCLGVCGLPLYAPSYSLDPAGFCRVYGLVVMRERHRPAVAAGLAPAQHCPGVSGPSHAEPRALSASQQIERGLSSLISEECPLHRMPGDRKRIALHLSLACPELPANHLPSPSRASSSVSINQSLRMQCQLYSTFSLVLRIVAGKGLNLPWKPSVPPRNRMHHQ